MAHQQQTQQQKRKQQPAQPSSKAMVRGKGRARSRRWSTKGFRTVQPRMTLEQIIEQQLLRIVALGGSIRASAWEAAQAQLALRRYNRRLRQETCNV